jgi:hypothetical protein
VTQPEAAIRLGVTLGQMKVLEMRTSQVPPAVLDVIDLLLAPPGRFVQTTIWEALECLNHSAQTEPAAGHDGASHA